MKHVRIVFEDQEYMFLRRLKGRESWRSFILKLAKNFERTNLSVDNYLDVEMDSVDEVGGVICERK